MKKKWSIGEITFDTKEDYRAGQRDMKRIKNLIAGVDLDHTGEVRELYRILQGQPFLFESEVGTAFRSYLLEQARGGEASKRTWKEGAAEAAETEKLSAGRKAGVKQVKKKRRTADKKKRKKKCILAAGLLASLAVMLFALYRIFSYDIWSYISERKMEELASCILMPYNAEVSEEHRIADLIASGLYTKEEAVQKVQ